MLTTVNEEWIVDLGAMTCQNANNNIIVGIEKMGKDFIGKVKDMPIELFAELAKKPDGERFIMDAVFKAEEAFLNAYIEEELERRR